MSEQNLGDQPSDIHIKRPIIPRTFRELDRQQVEFNKKMKKRERRSSRSSANKSQEFNSRYQITGASEDKLIHKLPEVIRNGNRIIAQWKNDQIHGFAQIFYQNGVYFKGQYQNGIKVKGHFKFKSGFQYIGHCFGNKFTGEGVLKFPNGKTIEGEWKNFDIVGNGKINYPKGEVYYGEIKEFKKHGKGYFYFSDGTKYEGEFVDGLINGKGSYFVDGKVVSAGTWLNGELLKEQNLDDQNLPFQSTMSKVDSKNEDTANQSKDLKQKKNFTSTSNFRSKKTLEQPKSPKKVHFN